MTICKICLSETEGEAEYHAACLEELFGTSSLPAIDLELSKVHTAGLAMAGRTSLSGVQKKISVNLSADRATLQVAVEGGFYILKPQTEAYPALPENEHVTTRLAPLVGIETGRCGLIPLKDNSLAFIVARFDRTPDGRKVRQEDFNQLAEQSPAEKYNGSSELCVRLLRKHATEPLIEILKFYRYLVFSWWTGNGDMHLKNFSLQGVEGRYRLTPAYDLVCTRLVIPDDPMAIPVQGKQDNLNQKQWMKFAEYCKIPERAARRVLQEHVDALQEATRMIQRSFLLDEMKEQYKTLLVARSKMLEATSA